MTSSATPEQAKARRRAGFRLEKRYPGIARQLRQQYDTVSWRARWGKAYYGKRTEQIRKDLAARYPRVYDRLLREELERHEHLH